MGSKGNVIYKAGLALVIGVVIFAVYFNNEATLERIKSARNARASAEALSAASGAPPAPPETQSVISEAPPVSSEASSVTSEAPSVPPGATSEPDPERKTSGRSRSLNFTLYDINNESKPFSDYRGGIAIMVFWSPAEEASVRLPEIIAEEIGLMAEDGGLGYGVSLISICSPGDAAGLKTDGFAEYVDKDGKLARLFSVDGYPATFFFNPDGELSGYQKGALTREQIARLALEAAESA